MKKIYCIASGSYSDWGIDYSFESESKRDDLLEILSNGDCHKYDLSLCDDSIDVDDIKIWYELTISDVTFYADKRNSVTDEYSEKSIWVYDGELSQMAVEITKKEFDNIKLYREKYEKIWQDLKAKVKYMIEVDGISEKDVGNLLGGE